jgi:hypothetical protein
MTHLSELFFLFLPRIYVCVYTLYVLYVSHIYSECMYAYMYVCMDGWMDGRMDGCVYGSICMYGWMDGCMDEWMGGWMDGWIDERDMGYGICDMNV